MIRDFKNYPSLMSGAIEVGDDGGAFQFGDLRIIASFGNGWDHVSVSRVDRCPTWEEMEFVREKFFFPAEVAFQLGISGNRKKNFHSYCLHWWRNQNTDPPLPERNMV